MYKAHKNIRNYPEDAESLSPSATATGVLVLTGSVTMNDWVTHVHDRMKTTYRSKTGLGLHVLSNAPDGHSGVVYPVNR